MQAAINPENERTQIFYNTRGCRIITTDGLPLVVIPIACPYLSDAGCVIYDHRPLACQMYDGRRDVIMRHTCLWNELEE